jgi:hypothetical protein
MLNVYMLNGPDPFMLSVVMLNVCMLNGPDPFMLSVVMLSLLPPSARAPSNFFA